MCLISGLARLLDQAFSLGQAGAVVTGKVVGVLIAGALAAAQGVHPPSPVPPSPRPNVNGGSIALGYEWPEVETPGLARRTISLPAISAPRCTVTTGCRSATVIRGRTAGVPGVPALAVQAAPRHVGSVCGTGEPPLVCAGPFTIPGAQAGPTPSVASQSVSAPEVRVTALCDVTSLACDGRRLYPGGPPLLTPGVSSWRLVPEGSISARTSRFYGALEPGSQALAWFSPIAFTAYVPALGPVPVMLCPGGCAVPMPPGAVTRWSITLTVTLGGSEHTATVPIEFGW